jgi:hypothetical protein
MAARSKGHDLITEDMTISRTASWTTPLTYTTLGSAYRSGMSGTDIANFYKRKRSGELLPHTTFTQYENRVDYSAGSYWGKNTNTGNWTSYSSFFPAGRNIPLDGADPSILTNFFRAAPAHYGPSLIQSAAARIQSSGWDAGTFIGELPQLRRMIRNIGRKTENMSRGHTAKRIQQLWLEGRYGWRTLAFDIRDLAEAVTEWDEQRKIHTERVGTSWRESWESRVAIATNEGSFDHVWSLDQNFSVRGAVSARISPPRFSIDPLKTAWELTRLSFVLDWVINVGNAIDAFRFLNASVAHTSSYGVHRTLTGTVGPENVEAAEDRELSVSYSGTCICESSVRIPAEISSLPLLTHRMITPEMSLDLMALHRVRSNLM